VGGTGSGKSEMLKTLIYEAIHRNTEAIIIVDPKGDLARETAKFIDHTLPNRKDKLVYVSPFDFAGFTPIINPLRLPPVPPNDYERMVDISTREIVATLQNIFQENNNSGFTEMMVSVLSPCIETLIRKGDADFWDLQRFMDSRINQDLVELGKQSPNESIRRFFLYDFESIPITTKDGIKWRTRNMLNSQVFAKLTTGQSTINLKQLIDDRKCIIINLDKGSMSSTVSSHFGKLVVSLIQVIAMQRGGMPNDEKVPTHLFIDEVHNYITTSIKHVLTEARSNKLYLTMAQQIVGQDMPSLNFKKILLGNTNIKIMAKSTNENYKELSDEFGIPVAKLLELPEYYFHVKVGNGHPFRIKGRSGLINDKNAMSDAKWKAIVKEQLAQYYTPEFEALNKKRTEDKQRENAVTGNAAINTKTGKPSKKKDEPSDEEPPFPFA
jgi:hypothetical protein